MRLADLRPGDQIEHPKTGFTWVLLKLEPVTRIYQWAPIPSRVELNRGVLVPRWSPPHDEESWYAEMDVTVTQYRR